MSKRIGCRHGILGACTRCDEFNYLESLRAQLAERDAEIAALRAVEQNNPFEKAASAALEILNEAFNQSNKTYNDALDASRKEPPA